MNTAGSGGVEPPSWCATTPITVASLRHADELQHHLSTPRWPIDPDPKEQVGEGLVDDHHRRSAGASVEENLSLSKILKRESSLAACGTDRHGPPGHRAPIGLDLSTIAARSGIVEPRPTRSPPATPRALHPLIPAIGRIVPTAKVVEPPSSGRLRSPGSTTANRCSTTGRPPSAATETAICATTSVCNRCRLTPPVARLLPRTAAPNACSRASFGQRQHSNEQDERHCRLTPPRDPISPARGLYRSANLINMPTPPAPISRHSAGNASTRSPPQQLQPRGAGAERRAHRRSCSTHATMSVKLVTFAQAMIDERRGAHQEPA
jgi:hypothetical protein